MGETRREFDGDFREDAVRLVRETGKPIAQVRRDLDINEGTLGNGVSADRAAPRRRERRFEDVGQIERPERDKLMQQVAVVRREPDHAGQPPTAVPQGARRRGTRRGRYQRPGLPQLTGAVPG